MRQEIKFPNKYNQCSSFCKKTECASSGNCVFGFNRIFGGARELRLDFNRCNLHCELCWSNNNDLSVFFLLTIYLRILLHVALSIINIYTRS